MTISALTRRQQDVLRRWLQKHDGVHTEPFSKLAAEVDALGDAAFDHFLDALHDNNYGARERRNAIRGAFRLVTRRLPRRMGECLAAAVPLLRDESEPVRSATVSIVLGIVVALEQPVWSANPPYEGDLASIRAMLVRPLEHAMTLGLDDNAATNVREFLSRGPM